jgi:thioester reductase-like protein
VPETFVDPEDAVGAGYGESKWISEKILSLAGSRTALRPVVVRIGQVSGGLNGCWNPLEWLPSIVQSTALAKCLPVLNQVQYRFSNAAVLVSLC